MKTGDEVYIKSEGEGAVRERIEAHFASGITISRCYGEVTYYSGEFETLKPTDRLVSELPEIARMTGCYVAVDEEGKIIMSNKEMAYYLEYGFVFQNGSEFVSDTITCPNCERFDRQWGPDGEVL